MDDAAHMRWRVPAWRCSRRDPKGGRPTVLAGSPHDPRDASDDRDRVLVTMEPRLQPRAAVKDAEA
jgi:hypothetical protein